MHEDEDSVFPCILCDTGASRDKNWINHGEEV